MLEAFDATQAVICVSVAYWMFDMQCAKKLNNFHTCLQDAYDVFHLRESTVGPALVEIIKQLN